MFVSLVPILLKSRMTFPSGGKNVKPIFLKGGITGILPLKWRV